MSIPNKPLMLLWVSDTKPFQASLAEAGLAERFEIAHVAPGAAATDDQLARCEVLLAFGAPPGTLARMPRLKMIQSMTAGVDGWMARKDLKPDVPLSAARGTHLPQMPENILGALFHITKHYATIAQNQVQSKWVRSQSATLSGKTLGILGLGAIGVDLARRAAALDMRVIGTKRSMGSIAHVDKVYGFDGTDEVLAESDFVVLLLPVTPATENMLDRSRLRRMKPTAWLINFGRGALIVDDDLIAAVREKEIAGAVLDVFRTEPLPSDHPFWQTPGIMVLPHIGGGHPDRDKWVASLLTENVRRHLAGEPLKELVDRDRGY
ncbi:MAG: D-2-hydroxyacid dehydrogenase [Hyphomicrobiaceae bacterium]|nr:D-2-hydroxyacid dehydrogenase [Hyphomicrobiaceae bacterium]